VVRKASPLQHELITTSYHRLVLTIFTETLKENNITEKQLEGMSFDEMILFIPDKNIVQKIMLSIES